MLPKLAVIVGPTGAGKTGFAIQLAGRLDGEIISADSRCFYRGMDIGTAKPGAVERGRVPHHLIDVTMPDQPWSLAHFQEQVAILLNAISRRNKLPMLVGGTGQYIRAVIQAWQVPVLPPNPALREALERWGGQIGPREMHARLGKIDPNAAAHMEPGNLRRSVRAFEVILSTGARFSAQRGRSDPNYDTLIIGLRWPRPELYRRVDERLEGMLRAGLVEEVRHLLNLGFSPALPAMSAIGYSEVVAYLHGRLTYDEMVTLIRRNTRTYIRRQANWFKDSDPDIHWLDMHTSALDEAAALVSRWR